jgi:glutathione synthase/RimK-type ligase-like ATP-grasp enzyme
MKIALIACTGWAGALERETAFANSVQLPNKQLIAAAWNDKTVDWTQFDCLIFRSNWDYFFDPAAFEEWLQYIEHLGIKTLNPIEVIRRNLHKFYLSELESKNVDIVPTIFLPKHKNLNLSIVEIREWHEAVIKPAVSGGAYLTKWFSTADIAAITAEYAPIAAERDLLIQPFLPEIQTEGEISIIFFWGKYSHAILKKPVNDDFRVQSQFGGEYTVYQPTLLQLAIAEGIVHIFGGDLLYARVDGVMHNGQFLLMELELIEPDLYFDNHPDAKSNFLKALAEI